MKEAAAEVNPLVQRYAGWQSERRSKTTIWPAASTGHPPHSFVFSFITIDGREGFQITAEGGKTGERAEGGGRKGSHCNVFSGLPNEPFYRL